VAGRGSLVARGEPGYEQARAGRVFNRRRPERYPDAVLLGGSDADVVAGVRLAAERGWTVAVRSGGHSWAALRVRPASPRDHPLPPADVSRAGGDVARHLDVPAVGGRAAAGLAARAAVHVGQPGRAGAHRHPAAGRAAAPRHRPSTSDPSVAAHGTGAYLGDTDCTRRQDRFLSDAAYARLAGIRAARDPAGRVASWLTADPDGLNVHA
jgi:hypothetical protein